MRVVAERIQAADPRRTSELTGGEIVEHRLKLTVDGTPRTFVVYLRASVLPSIDASVVYGDRLLEELLRFEPAALSMVYALVGRYRRCGSVELPEVVLDTTSDVLAMANRA